MKFRIFILSVLAITFVITPGYSANPRANVTLGRINHAITKKVNQINLYSDLKNYKNVINVESDDSDQSEYDFKYYPVILEIKDLSRAEDILNELEAIVYHSRGSLFLTSIPIENLPELPHNAGVDNFQFSLESKPNLDVAREVSGVNLVHNHLQTLEKVGDDYQHNVVTGICDTGFYPSHIMFNNCLKKWVIYDEFNGERTVYEGYDNIIANAPLTDDVTMTHATHVANIVAGFHNDIPYYGVAPASDFVSTTSKLSDVGILSGIEDIIEYAKETDRPAVVNISAGSYLGPHDGKDLVGRYLSELSKDAIICFSAGNYGHRSNCQSLNLDDYTTPIGSTWSDMSWTSFNVSGGSDAWGKDSKPFELRVIVWDQDEKEFKYIGEWLGGDANEGETFIDLGATDFFTDGGVWVGWGTYPENNRFNFALEYDYSTEPVSKNGPWSRYCVGYHIRKIYDDTHVDVYSDGIRTFLHGHGAQYCVAGTPDGTISNLACCPDVVAVGAWNSRSIVPDINLGERSWNQNTNCIAYWSAWGTSGDGRKLPHFSAPGNTLVSALSGAHFNYDQPKGDADYIAANYDGQRFFATAGTSMSSPFCAGVFALWLDVYPELTVHDAVEIASATANKSFDDITDPRWGAGAVDAYSGLLEVLKRADKDSIANIEINRENTPKVTLINGTINVFWPGVENPLITVYDLTGRKINPAKISPNQILIVNVTDAERGQSYNFKLK